MSILPSELGHSTYSRTEMESYNGEGSSLGSIGTTTLDDNDSDATVEEDWELLGAAALRPGCTPVLVEFHAGNSDCPKLGNDSLLGVWEVVEALPKVWLKSPIKYASDEAYKTITETKE